MFKPVRVAATLILLVSIGLIFVGAFVIGSGVSFFIFILVLLLLVLVVNLYDLSRHFVSVSI